LRVAVIVDLGGRHPLTDHHSFGRQRHFILKCLPKRPHLLILSIGIDEDIVQKPFDPLFVAMFAVSRLMSSDLKLHQIAAVSFRFVF
jgi:hypothetical protein